MKARYSAAPAARGRDPRRRARRFWVQVHSVIGMTAGAMFVVIGLTGSLMVFSPPVDRALSPGLLRLPVDSIGGVDRTASEGGRP